MNKIINCPGCGKKKPYHALSLCEQCYHREYKRRWRVAHRNQYLSTQRRCKTQWRINNPEKAKAQDQRRYRRVKAKRLAILRERVGTICADCGEDRPAALEYHHKDGSGRGRALGSMTWKQFNKEFPTLQVLCGTCHNIRHRG